MKVVVSLTPVPTLCSPCGMHSIDFCPRVLRGTNFFIRYLRACVPRPVLASTFGGTVQRRASVARHGCLLSGRTSSALLGADRRSWVLFPTFHTARGFVLLILDGRWCSLAAHNHLVGSVHSFAPREPTRARRRYMRTWRQFASLGRAQVMSASSDGSVRWLSAWFLGGFVRFVRGGVRAFHPNARVLPVAVPRRRCAVRLCVCCLWCQGAQRAACRPCVRSPFSRPYHVFHSEATVCARYRPYNDPASDPLKGHVGEYGTGRLRHLAGWGFSEWHVDLTGPNCQEESQVRECFAAVRWGRRKAGGSRGGARA